MRPAAEKTVKLKLEIPNPPLAQSLLRKWTQDSDVSVTILRGRVTEHEARFQLEIRGRAATIAQIVQESTFWDVSRRYEVPVTVGASA